MRFSFIMEHEADVNALCKVTIHLTIFSKSSQMFCPTNLYQNLLLGNTNFFSLVKPYFTDRMEREPCTDFEKKILQNIILVKNLVFSCLPKSFS